MTQEFDSVPTIIGDFLNFNRNLVELPKKIMIKIAPKEHKDFKWVPINAAIEMVFSNTNADALRELNAKKRAKG